MINLLDLSTPILNNVVDPTAQRFEYRVYLSDTVDEFGVAHVSYSDWVWAAGSVQPVASQAQDIEGVEPAGKSIQVWCSINFKTLDRQNHCDQVRYDGVVYNCFTRTDWYAHNGWTNFTCVADRATMNIE